MPKGEIPYQGKLGDYQCRNCGRRWTSGHSHPNVGLWCSNCNSKVYPTIRPQ
ncbi:hypothetical protein PO909_012351 [Leuciscus waleckii]